MLDVIIAPEIVLDAWSGQGELQEVAQSAIRRSLTDGMRVWQYVAALPQIVNGHRPRQSRGSGGPSQVAAFGHDAPEPCGELFRRCQWLSALAEDADLREAEDAVAEQLTKAASRLNQAVVVTRNPYLLAHCSQAVSCKDFLESAAVVPKVEFVDLHAQQDQIRASLERGIFRVLRHGQYIMGPEIGELEERLAAYVGVPHCVSVASGTDSLLIALMALGVSVGDEVITVPYTWISTAEVISLLGAKPVFVDIEADSYNVNVDQLEAAVTARTKAIMPVSLYGQCPDMDRINAIADRYGIPVIEDAAQSFGATYQGRRSCNLSLVGSTSFFPSKPLGCYGDGGALFTSDDRLAALFRQIRVHGQKKKHHHDMIGINGRFDTLQAAVVLAKLDVFDEECAQRARCADRYTSMILERLAAWSLPEAEAARRIKPPRVASGNTSVFAQYTITSDFSGEIGECLQSQRIPSVKYYAVPLHLQPAFANLGYKVGDFPVAEAIARTGLSLPMSPGLRSADQERIIELVFRAIEQGR